MHLKTIAICALAAAAAAQAQTQTYSYSYAGAALPIFRDSANIITVANIFIPRAIQISKVTVNVEIDYPVVGDLNVFVYSPLLTRTKLLERNCGSQGSLSDVMFDDAALSMYSQVCPSTPGSFRGNEPLSNFNGQVSIGTWSLAVENNGSDARIGYLRSFTITVSGTPVTTKPITGPNAVFNVAGFQSGTVAPGEMINIEGVNLGPATAAVAGSGDLTNNLGGTQVSFDNVPAAISYSSANILTAQVPFSLTPGTKTTMVVSYNNAVSDPVTLDVVSSVPGIYTQGANGLGIVQAINPDGTLNSATNPATKGQNIVIYASGLGTVTPALNTGQAPPSSPLSLTTLPYSAMVDGVTASVTYAGAAPTFPGLYQLNITIPPNVRSGIDALTIFAAGGTSSQNGVSVFVK